MTTTVSPTLEIPISRSRSLEALYGILGALAFVLFLWLPLSAVLRIALIALLLMWLWSVFNQLRFMRQIEALRLSDGVSVLQQGVWRELDLRKNYFIAPFAVMFSASFADEAVSLWRKYFFPKHFVIFADAVPGDEHRKLRVWFKSYASRERHRQKNQGISD